MLLALLKLIALDTDDLAVIAANVQDAIVRSADISHDRATRSLIVPMNRFAWDAPGATRRLFPRNERRNAMLQISGVEALSGKGIERDENSEQILSLLTLSFHPSTEDGVDGALELIFADGATLRADIEALEIRLTDLGGAWRAQRRPKHA